MPLPEWCSPVDRRRLQAALDQLTATCVMQSDPVTGGSLVYPSEAAAREAVLTVAAIVVPILTASRRATEDGRRQAVEDLVEDLIVTAADYRPAPASSLEDFAARVRDALQTAAWWPALTPATARSGRPPRDAVAHRKAERERVVLPFLEEVDWTPTQWASKAGVSPHVTIEYLEGRSKLRTITRNRITYVLAKALNQQIRLPD